MTNPTYGNVHTVYIHVGVCTWLRKAIDCFLPQNATYLAINSLIEIPAEKTKVNQRKAKEEGGRKGGREGGREGEVRRERREEGGRGEGGGREGGERGREGGREGEVRRERGRRE